MDITHDIIARIVTKCKEKGIDVSPQLAAFYAKSLVLTKFSTDVELSSKKIESLIEMAVEALTQGDSPKLETVKMQVAVATAKEEWNVQKQQLQEKREYMSRKLQQSIIKKTDISQVFGDLILYILHETKLFDQSSDLIEKETQYALEGVIPRSYISVFIKQEPNDKLNQLKDLWKLVWGIRLFNKATNKGGAGIEALNEQLETSLPITEQDLKHEISETLTCVSNYVLVLHSGQLDNEAKAWRLRTELTHKRQYLAFLNHLQDQVQRLKSQEKEILATYKKHVDDINKLLEQPSVPKVKIYPMFMGLAEAWGVIEALVEQLQEVRKIMEIIANYKQSYEPALTKEDIERAKHPKVEQEKKVIEIVERKEHVEEEKSEEPEKYEEPKPVEKAKVTINIKMPATLIDAAPEIIPEFGGFCPVSLVSEQKLPEPGNKEVGYVKFRDKYYSFSSKEAASEFLKNPQKYLDGVIDTARQNPELIYLLQLEDKLPKSLILEDPSKIGAFMKTSKEKTSIQIQTDVHPIESYIDPKYEWNEWKMRKHALMLANLRTKRTHSTQTHNSHFRRDSETQKWLPKDQATQTLKDKATQPPKQVRYIEGLRGGKKPMSVVTLTLDPT